MLENQTVTTLQREKTNKQKPRLFDFTDYADFLNAYVGAFGKYSHGPYNLKNWANRLGYKSPSSLAMVLNKQRLPTVKMIVSFSEDFNFTKSERKYFEILVEIERKKIAGKDFSELLSEANKLSGQTEYQKINYDQFSVVSDWHCYAIKALVSNPNFLYDLDWIHKALRRKITRAQIKNAIQNLKNVGLLVDDSERGLKENPTKTHTGNQVPSAAIKNHHRGMLVQAAQALDEQTVKNRMFQGLTLNVKKKDDLSKAMADIVDFVNEFNEKYRDDKAGDAVYQLNIQLFEHTKDLE
ncbi:MAG: DUF4423 domain-containing protein [Halobacteriovoraceae bacterium]|nr:DUF4423 domain-containing protein [Halobacteriovoraceae bacterium]